MFDFSEAAKELVNLVATAGWIGVAALGGFLAHKILMVGIISWTSIKIIGRVMDAIGNRVTNSDFIEKLAVRGGYTTPLTRAEMDDILMRIAPKADK